MNTKLVIILVFVACIFGVCCTTVQTRYNIRSKNVGGDTISEQNTSGGQSITKIVVEQKEPEKLVEPPKKDTVVIVLNTETHKAYSDIDANISRANELFESKDYKNAFDLYRFILKRLEKTNPNYWNVRFRYEECKISLGKVDEGLEGIEFLLSLIEEENATKENLLASFIKILCQNGKKEKAKYYFEVLKKNFPNSKYVGGFEVFQCL